MASTQVEPAAKPMSEKQRLKLEKFAKKEKQAQEALLKQQQGNSSSKAKKTKEQDGPAVQSKDWVEETPVGQKKILKSLDDDFTKTYLPTVVESAWYNFWEKERLFEPRTEEDGSLKPKGKYVIAIPPPNVWKSISEALGQC
jgi:valyl-tRNA synthetase